MYIYPEGSHRAPVTQERFLRSEDTPRVTELRERYYQGQRESDYDLMNRVAMASLGNSALSRALSSEPDSFSALILPGERVEPISAEHTQPLSIKTREIRLRVMDTTPDGYEMTYEDVQRLFGVPGPHPSDILVLISTQYTSIHIPGERHTLFTLFSWLWQQPGTLFLHLYHDSLLVGEYDASQQVLLTYDRKRGLVTVQDLTQSNQLFQRSYQFPPQRLSQEKGNEDASIH